MSDCTPRAIELRLDAGETYGYAAVVELRGEHDLATANELRDALAPIGGTVLVDLSECRFLASTVIMTLVLDHRARLRDGHRLDLLVPVENRAIARTLDVSGVREIMTVHPSYF